MSTWLGAANDEVSSSRCAKTTNWTLPLAVVGHVTYRSVCRCRKRNSTKLSTLESNAGDNPLREGFKERFPVFRNKWIIPLCFGQKPIIRLSCERTITRRGKKKTVEKKLFRWAGVALFLIGRRPPDGRGSRESGKRTGGGPVSLWVNRLSDPLLLQYFFYSSH